MNIQFEINPNEKDSKQIYDGLVAYNKPYFGHKKLIKFACFLRDEDNGICGGATGEIADDLAFVWLLWVDEKCRGGAGRKIMNMVEHELKVRQVQEIHLDTYSFQAPEFYNKLGFMEVSRMMVNKTKKIEKIFFIKEL